MSNRHRKRDEAQDDRTEKINSAMCPFIAMYPASNNQLVPLFVGACKLFLCTLKTIYGLLTL